MHDIAKVLMAVCEDSIPLWQSWDGSLDGLPEFAHKMATGLPAWNLTDDEKYSTLTNIVWCLDRLLPPDDPAPFIPFLGHAIRDALATSAHAAMPADSALVKHAVYAWGRRLSPGDRACLPTLAAGGTGPRAYAEAMAAWAETCPVEDAASLFQWPEVAGYHEGESFGVLISEFVKRISRADERLVVLAPLALTIADELVGHFSIQIHTERDYRELTRRAGFLIDLTRQIVSDVASLTAALDVARPPESDLSRHWLRAVLGAMQIPALTDLFHRLDELNRQPEAVFNMPDFHELAMRLWIAQQNAEKWDILHGALIDLDGYERHMAIERLTEIAPPDRFDIWADIVQQGPYRLPAFNGFCRWLAADHRRRLLSYTSVSFLSASDEIEMAESAFRSYLHLASQDELDTLWQDCYFLPFWQALLLDRFLHAPEAVKPSAVLYSISSVEDDFRLEDRLNLRRV
jgi:hypothetical protein